MKKLAFILLLFFTFLTNVYAIDSINYGKDKIRQFDSYSKEDYVGFSGPDEKINVTFDKKNADFSELIKFNGLSSDGDKMELSKDNFTLSGIIVNNVEKLEITWDGDYDPYIVKSFKPGDSNFKYNISIKLGNLNEGENTYLVRGYTKKGTVEEIFHLKYTPSIGEIADKTLLQSKFGKVSKFCMIKTCIDLTKTVYYRLDKNNKYIFSQYSGELLYKYDINGKQIGRGEHGDTLTSYNLGENEIIFDYTPDAPYSENFTINKLKNGYMKIGQELNCGGSPSYQIFYNLKGKEIDGSLSNFDFKLPKKVKIGDLTYNLSSYSFNKADKNIISLNSKNLNNILDNLDLLNPELIIKYDDLGFGGTYKISDKKLFNGNNSMNALFGDKFYKIIDLETYNSLTGDIKNLEITKKIFTDFYGEGKGMGIAPTGKLDFDHQIDISKITNKDLPIFTISKVNKSKGILKLTKNYEVFTTAELCKPAIYVYDKENRENKITIGFNLFGGEFTHLNPIFNISNGWNFKANNGKVEVGTGTFDYLYYAVKVGNYEFNKEGFQVKGKDVLDFFDKKLTKLSFKDKEKQDFIDFWKEKFSEDKNYMISFKYNDEVEKYIPLTFEKKANTINRIIMEAVEIEKINDNYLYNGEKADKLDEMFLKDITRDKDFDVFEWGGVLINDNKYLFY